ncbi:MAG TPA: efflux RND transporter periplasmic adaptor subunit [Thermodesulfovibrionales bacterium]|nr:efflux RND transporter periplasmic adaptor subunit [Thermodesulfovibrionales bacterium]
MKKILLVLAVLLAVGIGVSLVSYFRGPREEGVLELSGNVEVTEYDMGFKIAGRVERLLTDEGQKVTKGEPLAALDHTELESQVTQGRAYLREAEVRLKELRAGSRPQEIEQAKANLRFVEAELEKARKDYERAGRLFQKDAISVSQFDAAKSAYDSRIAQQKGLQELLSMVKEGPRREEISAAEQRVQQARAALVTAEEKLKDTVIYAPVMGVVIRKNIELGETVGAGIPIFTLGDLENPWIKVYVKEDKLGLVKLGQKAKVTVDSYPGKVYEGRVTFISPEAEFTPKNVQTKEERVKLVFGVKVRVKNINDELKPSMPADVRILLK